MLCLTRPSQKSIDMLLDAERGLPFSYSEVGATRYAALQSFTVDHNRALLGHGYEIFERAKLAVGQWKMFAMPWVHVCWPDATTEVGTTVAVLISHLGFWSLNPCRVVYVLEESGAVEKFGFAYGTLPRHGELGEERFSVEFYSRDQSVWYDLYAFSRPGFMAKLGYPFARALQRRFARDSLVAMQNAVSEANPRTSSI